MPKWQRDKMSKKKDKKKEEEAVNDPCCPSADGYGEYRNREQIERQALEVRSRQKEQQMQNSTNGTSGYDPQQSVWYYADNSTGAVQGPFSGVQMDGWKSAGFFPESTPVKRGEEGEFVAMGGVDFMTAPVELVQEEISPEENGVEAVEAPVDEHIHEPELETAAEAPIDDEVYQKDDLNADTANDNPHEPEVEMCVPPPSDDEDDRAEVEMCVPPPSDDEDEDGPEVDMCVPPPSDDEEERPEVDLCLPPPSDDEGDDQPEVIDNAADEEPPAYYPPDENADIPYPVVDDSVPYPVDDAVPYPVDAEYPVDVAYPVDVEYPVDDAYGYPDTDGAYGNEMAAVAPYPGADVLTSDVQESTDEKPSAVEGKKKKKFDGDKVVVGFVPSTVKRKGAAAKSKKSTQ